MGVMDFLTGRDIERQHEKIQSLVDDIQSMARAEYNTARALAIALHDKHYPEVTNWRVAEDVTSVLHQIDNMTANLVRRDK